jgi:hypothetical protein
MATSMMTKIGAIKVGKRSSCIRFTALEAARPLIDPKKLMKLNNVAANPHVLTTMAARLIYGLPALGGKWQPVSKIAAAIKRNNVKANFDGDRLPLEFVQPIALFFAIGAGAMALQLADQYYSIFSGHMSAFMTAHNNEFVGYTAGISAFRYLYLVGYRTLYKNPQLSHVLSLIPSSRHKARALVNTGFIQVK